MVSTTAWQSSPAVKPGPTPMTTGASVMAVPRFFFARMASTTTPGCKTGMQAPFGSVSTGMTPVSKISSAWAGVSACFAVISSTVVSPKTTA